MRLKIERDPAVPIPTHRRSKEARQREKGYDVSPTGIHQAQTYEKTNEKTDLYSISYARMKLRKD